MWRLIARLARVAVAISLLSSGALGWGGLFNRFSPEMLSNLGYGGHGYGAYRSSQPLLQESEAPVPTARCSAIKTLVPDDGPMKSLGTTTRDSKRGTTPYKHLDGISKRFHNPVEVFQELQEDEEPCYGKKCTSNEHCCPGTVCVDVDGIVGSCLFAYGLKQGELCRRDSDCETGLLCADSADGRTCQPPLTNRKQYSEDCTMSSECDISKGLCCQLQRRHRQAPRKVCSYFKDPLICIGPVAADQVKDEIEHTAGEKRITGKVASFNHIRRK